MATREPPVEYDVTAGPADQTEVALTHRAFACVQVVAFDRRLIGLQVIAGEQVRMHAPVDQLEPVGMRCGFIHKGKRGIAAPQRPSICSWRYSGR